MSNVVKGLGVAGKVVGKFIGGIPLVKDGAVDEFLQDAGDKMEHNAAGMEMKAVKKFAAIANPETGVFVNKMDDMIRIYNHTSRICFDNEKIYLLA